MATDQDEIHRLCVSKYVNNRLKALEIFRENFNLLSDKPAAWCDLLRLTSDEDSNVRLVSAKALEYVYPFISDEYKYGAWTDLIRLTYNWDLEVKRTLDNSLRSTFPLLPEGYKYKAWKDLLRLTSKEHSHLKDNWKFIIVINDIVSYTFQFIPETNKSAAWNDLHQITSGKSFTSALLLRYAFQFIPEEHKSTAWNDLHWMLIDKNWNIRGEATIILVSVFPFIPEEHKSTAWDDLHKRTDDENLFVKRLAAAAIGPVFRYLQEEYRYDAWYDMHRLTSNEDLYVRSNNTYSLGIAFKVIPEKHKSDAWDDLIKLTDDENPNVREKAACAIGHAFPFIPEEHKSDTLNDLHMLTRDIDTDVKTYANYSLGKVCIYKASISEDEDVSRELLEKAISYFEKSLKMKTWDNPAKFCYPFYCSFNAIFFKKESSTREIEDYLIAARKEIQYSKIKEKLIESIERLSEALKIAREIYESGGDWQEALKRCSEICDRVEQIMEENKEKTPDIHGLYKIAKPSFDKTIQGLIKAADVACKEAKGTPAEAIVCPVKTEIQRWCVEDQIKIETKIDRLYSLLKIKVPDIPENRIIIDKIDEIKNTKVVEEQLEIITLLVMSLPSTSIPEQINDLKEEMNNRFDKIDESQHRMELSLEQIHQKLDQNLDKLHNLSLDFKTHGKEVESEYIDTFENEIKTLIAERDSETLDIYVEKLVQNRYLLLDEIERSSASDKEKKEGEKSIFELKDLPRKIKEKMISATTEVSKELVVSLIASLILESVFPLLGPAAKEVVKILVSVINSRKD